MSALKIKVVFGNDIRLFRYEPSDNLYEELSSFVSSSFDLKNYQMLYEDLEGDKITITDINDLNDALECAKSVTKKSLKIFIRASKQSILSVPNRNKNDPNDEKKYNGDGSIPNINNCGAMIPDLIKTFQEQLNGSKNSNELIESMLKNENVKNILHSPFCAPFLSQGIGKEIQAEFVKNVSVPDGSYYPQNTILTKTWKLRNIGSQDWDNNIFLFFLSGNKSLTLETKYPIQQNVKPGQSIDVSAMIKTPNMEGRYICYFRLKKNGVWFGPKLWCDIFVINSNENEIMEGLEESSNKHSIKKKKRALNKSINVKQLNLDKKNEKLDRKQIKLKNKTLKLNQKLIKTNEEILNEEKNNVMDGNATKNEKKSEALIKKQNKLKEQLNKNEIKLKQIEKKQKIILEDMNHIQSDKDKKKEMKRKEKKEKKERKKAKKEKNKNKTEEEDHSSDMIDSESDAESFVIFEKEEKEDNNNNNNNNSNEKMDDFKFIKELEIIQNMGFADTITVRELLIKEAGNIYAVVQQLLDKN